MKPTTFLLAAILTLNASLLFAGNDVFSSGSSMESTVLNISALVPSTPAEATFEDVFMVTDVASLAPSLPAEADFTDAAPDPGINAVRLAPSTPAEADFSDEPGMAVSTAQLAPVTPAVADFD